MAFLHGVETIELNTGPIPIQTARSSVILLVGLAFSGPQQVLTQVATDSDSAQFGLEVPGSTIPKALSAIKAHGSALVLVVNIYNETTHTTAVTAETVNILNGKAKTAFPPLGATFTLTNSGATVTYVRNTDYTVDSFGDIVVISTAITEGQSLKATYKKFNSASVIAADLIGTIDGTTNVRTGFKLADLAYTTFGYKPKLIICPGYSTLTAVETEMLRLSDKFKAMSLIDAPIGTTPSVAITGRGSAGTINFNVSNPRAILLYPHMKAYDAYTNADELRPYSQFMAGLISKTDNDLGYWFSPSNKVISGITGVERIITCDYTDQNSEANLLNANGITTYYSSFGTGIRAWGNRTAAFPASADVKTFIPLRRIGDVLEDTIEQGVLPFIDLPLTKMLCDAIRESVNGVIRTLIQRGGLIDGSQCTFLPERNNLAQLSAGQATFSIDLMGPVPGERLTFEVTYNTKLLANLFK